MLRWCHWICLACIAALGCRSADVYPAAARRQQLFAEAAAPASKFRAADEAANPPSGPLSLDRLVTLAVANHPEIAIAQARVESARGKLVQAGLYPNPRISWEGDDMLDHGSAAGKQGPIFEQEIVTGGKLAFAQAAAAQGVAVADWQAITRRYELITRVRLAYFEVLLAWRELDQTKEFVKLAEKSLEVAKAVKEAGVGMVIEPDIIRAQIEVDQSRIRLAQAQQRSDAAWKLLALAVGMPNLPVTPLEGKLESPAPRYQMDVLAQMLSRSSELQEVRAAQLQAEGELRKAQAAVTPNVHLRIQPFYDFPEQQGMIKVEAGMALPFHDRNQGNILTAQADLVRAAQEARSVELKLQERLTAAQQRYRNAREQVESYEKIVPKAQKAMELFETSFKAGAVKIDSVLDAQRTLIQSQLQLVQARGELWKSVAEIAGLLQLDSVAGSK